jgi:hypothetical protein
MARFKRTTQVTHLHFIQLIIVMAGLVPAIHKHREQRARTSGANLLSPRLWMAGTSPAMTVFVGEAARTKKRALPPGSAR